MSKLPSARTGIRSTTVSRKMVRIARGELNSIRRACWSLPSGESLAEFALRFGFLVPPLLRPSRTSPPGPAHFQEVR